MTPDQETRYEQLLVDAPEATLFHTRAWARIVTAAFPQLEDLSTILTTSAGEHALPVFRWRRLGGLLATRHSSFPFLYGGPVPARAEAWIGAQSVLTGRAHSAVLIGNPFAADGARLEDASPTDTDWETTHMLTLPETVEAFWSGILTTRKRNDIRRLTRKGVEVATSREPADIEAVYGLYLKRMATWSQRPGLIYPLALYERQMAADDATTRLYVARFEGRIVGGTFVCCWNGIWHYQAGYFDHDARSLRPNVLVQERIIRDAIETGARIYDMLPSAGIASVEAFKESFGGRRTRFPRWEREGCVHGLIRRLRGRG